jgi:hypothetical protein
MYLYGIYNYDTFGRNIIRNHPIKEDSSIMWKVNVLITVTICSGIS